MIEYPFWVNNFNRVKNYQKEFPLVTKIFDYPVSFWYGDRDGKYCCNIDEGMGRLFKRASPQLPILVIYNMPNRDMGHHSKGGAKTKEAYLEFIEAFSRGVDSKAPFVIYEPDAIPHATLMNEEERDWRLELMREGLKLLTDNTNALVYVDVGHSNWLAPHEVGELLDKVSNDKVKGFAVNVSNYRTTEESMRWALKVCEHRKTDHFVIDTSRNGSGPYGNDWCNPPNRSLGHPPTTKTPNNKCDAFLWIKVPGESDGKCNGGPRAGRFWPEYATELVSNTTWLDH